MRVAIENRNEDSFYDHGRYDSQDFYAAYRLRPDGQTLLDAHFEYFNVNFTDNAGWNRATQDLIDHGRYISGQGVTAAGSRVPGAGAVRKRPTGPRWEVVSRGQDGELDTADDMVQQEPRGR